MKDPAALYFEFWYLKTLNWFLTEKWALLQGGRNQEALELWIMMARALELDNKARRDLLLLAQSGLVGRTQANKLIWNLMAGPALEEKYLDLSNLVSNQVGRARKEFGRPPRGHHDLAGWDWSFYAYPQKKDHKFAPTAVPKYPVIHTGPGGQPLPPPDCWGPGSAWK